MVPFDSVFPLPEAVSENLATWERPSESSNGIREALFCKICGVRIVHRTRLSDGSFKDVAMLKAGCVEGLDWSKAVHIFCRTAVVPIPEGAERWEDMPGS